MSSRHTTAFVCFFLYAPPTSEIYTLSLHDALPISSGASEDAPRARACPPNRRSSPSRRRSPARSEEHTSELQSLRHLVCRLLLEKKKKKNCQTRTRHIHGKVTTQTKTQR